MKVQSSRKGTMRFFILLFLFCINQVHASNGFPICNDKKNCPGWMAQMVTGVPSVCSSFLIQPQLVLTNRHCLPPSLRKPGSSCENVRFKFPQTPQFSADQAECESVLDTSDSLPAPMKWIVDVALIKLKKPVARPTLEISSESLRANETVEVFKIDPAPLGKNTPILSKMKCEMGAALLNVFFTQDPSPEMTLLHCPIVSGNSGSPILNSKGKAVGIIWGSGGEANPSQGGSSFKLAVGSAFRCLKIGGPLFQLSGQCQNNLPPKVLAALEKDYVSGRSESVEETEKRSRLAKKIEESFSLLHSRFGQEMKKQEHQEMRSLFGWIAKESSLKDSEKKFMWGRYILIPYCVHQNDLKAHIEEKGLRPNRLRFKVPIPVANLVRVTGEPDLYFTPLMKTGEMQISADLSRQPASQQMELSYQIETAPEKIELAVIKIPHCQ